MRFVTIVLGVVVAAGCASAGARTTTSTAPAAVQDTTGGGGGIGPQYPSTYKRHPNPPVLIRNATIMTAAGQEIQGGSILFRERTCWMSSRWREQVDPPWRALLRRSTSGSRGSPSQPG